MEIFKKCASFGFTFLSLIFFICSAHALPMSRLELSAPVIYPGDTFQLEVRIDGVEISDEVESFGFDVNYDPLYFDYIGATVNTIDFYDNSDLFDETDVAGSIYTEFPFLFPGPNGDNILLASLSFTSLLPGNSILGITSDLSDGNEGLITFLIPQTDITKSIPVNPVPEPATILLLASGIFGMGVFGRKKFRIKK